MQLFGHNTRYRTIRRGIIGGGKGVVQLSMTNIILYISSIYNYNAKEIMIG